MHKVTFAIAVCMAVTALSSCASSPSPKGAFSGSSGGSAAEKKAASAGGKAQKEPDWVSNPRAAYPEAQYVSAVGYGADRESAEKNALGALIAVFGQTVKGETTVTSRYSEAVQSGAIEITEGSDVDRAVKTSFDLDSVVGAEIKATWDDGNKTKYALAVMERARAAMLYSNLLETNEETITKLIAIPDADKNTLDAYARYDLAAAIGDMNGRFLNVLSVVNPAAAAAKGGSVRKGDQLRLECLRIAQNIPIAVTVANDRDGRIKAALSQAISASGFKTGGTGSRYALDGTLTLSEVVLKNNDNKFVRYIVDARLTDTATGAILMPYNVQGREGHSTVPEAENRALRAAEKKIAEDFNKAFSGYLAQLSAKK
jgi:hypothetical protein